MVRLRWSIVSSPTLHSVSPTTDIKSIDRNWLAIPRTRTFIWNNGDLAIICPRPWYNFPFSLHYKVKTSVFINYFSSLKNSHVLLVKCKSKWGALSDFFYKMHSAVSLLQHMLKLKTWFITGKAKIFQSRICCSHTDSCMEMPYGNHHTVTKMLS